MTETRATERAAESMAALHRALEQSPAYRALPLETQQRFARDLGKITQYLVKPEPTAAAQGMPRATGHGMPRASAQADAVDTLKGNLAQPAKQVGKDFRAGAIREGVQQFGEMVQKVDFPKFVGGLIQNVFQAVVDASIQQMQAYGELLAGVSKSVDDFAADHISDNQVREFLSSRHPSAVVIERGSDGQAHLRPGRDDGANVGAAYGIDGLDLSDDDSEAALILAAKKDMARQRQQQLATMVLLGINRIVVTNGQINAKVVFDMRASDEALRRGRAGMTDEEKNTAQIGAGWVGGIVGGASASHEHETTVSSALDDTSESKAAVKAQLSGDVRLSFKSETFPLERMVDVMGMDALSQKAAPGSPAAGRTGGSR